MSRNLKIKSTQVAFLCPITTLSRNTIKILETTKFNCSYAECIALLPGALPFTACLHSTVFNCKCVNLPNSKRKKLNMTFLLRARKCKIDLQLHWSYIKHVYDAVWYPTSNSLTTSSCWKLVVAVSADQEVSHF